MGSFSGFLTRTLYAPLIPSLGRTHSLYPQTRISAHFIFLCFHMCFNRMSCVSIYSQVGSMAVRLIVVKSAVPISLHTKSTWKVNYWDLKQGFHMQVSCSTCIVPAYVIKMNINTYIHTYIHSINPVSANTCYWIWNMSN